VVEVGGEDVLEKPAPAVTWRAVAIVVVVPKQAELIARQRRWLSLSGVVDGVGDDFGAERGVAREHA
jgi:hypothetical protein